MSVVRSADAGPRTPDFAELRQRFFDAYLAFHPEEASTLGVDAHDHRLREQSPEALRSEKGWWQERERELDAVARESLSPDEQLDHLMMSRVVRFHLHSWDALWSSVDWTLYPYAMLMAQRVHLSNDAERRAFDSRLGEVPRFLEEHAQNLRDADAMLTSFFVERLLPLVIEDLGGLPFPNAPRASEAYAAHLVWLREQPTTEEPKRLGEAELGWRLREIFGIDEGLNALIATAREQLALAQDGAMETAGLTSFEAVNVRANELQKRTPGTKDELEPLYRGFHARALRCCREHRLFNLPEPYEVSIDWLPLALRPIGCAGNWPAPLLDGDKLGHLMIDPDPENHSLAWGADLMIHEVAPGHHLQSLWWQRHFCDHASPVRFLMVHDQVAIPRHYWAGMLNIEGWAVYAEELMRRHGLFDPDEELFVWLAHCMRAARVVVDIELHRGAMETDEAERFLIEQVCLPEARAGQEVRRYLQIPLQASTYLLGRLQIEALADGADDLAAFHDRFFSFGPVDPASIARNFDASPDALPPGGASLHGVDGVHFRGH